MVWILHLLSHEGNLLISSPTMLHVWAIPSTIEWILDSWTLILRICLWVHIWWSHTRVKVHLMLIMQDLMVGIDWMVFIFMMINLMVIWH